MKRAKKIMAMLLSLAMVLGMSLSAYAATIEVGNGAPGFKITGLSKDDQTEIKLYQIAVPELSSNGTYTWKWTNGCESYFTLTGNAYTLNDESGLKAALANQTPVWNNTNSKTDETSIELKGLERGLYAVVASGTSTTYNLMLDQTFDYEKGAFTAKTAVVQAKGDSYKVLKKLNGSQSGNAGIGDSLTFDIETVFPSFSENATDKSFSITDTPDGMKIRNVEVSVNGIAVTSGTNTYSVEGLTNNNGGAVTITFAQDYINADPSHAGEIVNVRVTAEITDISASNTASSNKNIGQNTGDNKVDITTGTLSINKKDTEDNFLAGATFNVLSGNTALKFVSTNEAGVYKYDAASGTADVVTPESGKITLQGLPVGTYTVKETKAPEGYTLNETDTPDGSLGTTESPSMQKEVTITDTRLASLPSTGGIGTTIFTIGGCLIMIAAAALFFASRRKTSK